MTLIEAKESLKLNGYCDFELKDFNKEFYNLFESLKYIDGDTNYLNQFKIVRFDYRNEVDASKNVSAHYTFDSFIESNNKKSQIIKEYDEKYISQVWLASPCKPADSDYFNPTKHTTDRKEFHNVYYRILEHFYGENENDVNCGLQWTCYSEGCFLKDHNDGQGEEYQNTCAILIYLNEEWEEEWGGNLLLRNTKNPNHKDRFTQYKVVPKFGKVAIIDLKIFDVSHAVEKIIGDHNRCTLLAFATSNTKKPKKYI
jgi:Rps23 Pro-64 3,4-dihydroxylase Tpa1-like proline 4-hydroxylase